MPTALPMLAKLGSTEKEPNYLDTREIVRRVETSLPDAVIDWQRGDRWVQETLQQLIDKQAPEVILAGHRTLFGRTVQLSMSYPEWPDEQVYAVVSGIDRGLGDALFLKLDGPFNLDLLRCAAQDFSRALSFPFFLECNYQYRFQTITRPGGVAPDEFLRWWHGDEPVSITVRELTDWSLAVRDMILDWLSSYDNETQRAGVISRFPSPDAFADAALRELQAIGPVQSGVKIEVAERPWQTFLTLVQNDWTTLVWHNGPKRA